MTSSLAERNLYLQEALCLASDKNADMASRVRSLDDLEMVCLAIWCTRIVALTSIHVEAGWEHR